jgi:hypothetical protein
VLTVCCLILFVIGCQRHVAGTPESGGGVDTLPLGLAAVEEISGFDGLTREVDSDEPMPDTYLPDGPCHAMADQGLAYGATWLQFRSVADSAKLTASRLSPVASVAQTLVAYPDAPAAQKVFDRHANTIAECAALEIPGLDGAVTRPDGRTALWLTDGMATVFAIEAATLVGVSVVALPDSARIASHVSQAIIDRIR